ncbi:MAG TPA: SWIM zinc finger family protein [Ilumatobacter sp.]|nr:SWIM zinc finger family protein [Ilumatobacter sp.]
MKPRKPYGANPPGRLPATMIKVLAAELSDQGRLSRGKRYWAEDAVVDNVVGHGAVTAVIQGSRPDPYVATIEATEGTGVPSKREVWITCTCPDDGVETEACKHAVAALFALSDEVAIEPALIERWRSGSARRRPPAAAGLAEVVPLRRQQPASDAAAAPVPPTGDPLADELAMLLGAPNAAPPEFPDVTPIRHTGIRDRQLADALADAIEHLAIDWG